MKNISKKLSLLGVAALAGVLFGCSEQSPQPTTALPVEPEKQSDPVIAIVGDSQIRSSQLSVLMERLSNEAAGAVDEQVRKNMIESLVRLRAIAIEAEAQLTDDERLLLDAKVQAYRDELLTQAYLKKNITPNPVTHEMVAIYYNENIDKFTEKGYVRYQAITVAKSALPDNTRDKVLKKLAEAKNSDDWKLFTSKLNDEGIPVELKASNVQPEQIKDSLRAQVVKLTPGEVSDLIFGDEIAVVRVIERQQDHIKPLQMVSAEIRKMLVPIQVKQSVRETAQQILSKTKVEYVNAD